MGWTFTSGIRPTVSDLGWDYLGTGSIEAILGYLDNIQVILYNLNVILISQYYPKLYWGSIGIMEDQMETTTI